MRRLVRYAALPIIAAGTTVAVLLAADDGGEDGSPRPAQAARSNPFLRGGVRYCWQRVEGGRITPRPRRDAMIGPVAFSHLRDNYRTTLKSGRAGYDYPPGLNAHPIKSVLLVRAGARVTLIVPRSQRRWMRLFYGLRGRRGEHAITLHACRRFRSPSAQRRECSWSPHTACRWRNTQFAGGVYVDFDNAPRRGRCAEVADFDRFCPKHWRATSGWSPRRAPRASAAARARYQGGLKARPPAPVRGSQALPPRPLSLGHAPAPPRARRSARC